MKNIHHVETTSTKWGVIRQCQISQEFEIKVHFSLLFSAGKGGFQSVGSREGRVGE